MAIILENPVSNESTKIYVNLDKKNIVEDISGMSGNDHYYLDNGPNNDFLILTNKTDQGEDTCFSSVSIDISKAQGIENLVLTNWDDPVKNGNNIIYGHPTNVLLDYVQGDGNNLPWQLISGTEIISVPITTLIEGVLLKTNWRY